ncbi:cyclic pyranopterin phosphate synthase MoaA [Verrucomicrobiaceae bacterium SCGC AG-212-N21]|nr:cyclic pyranopterin phosphate synthase MoaA [Verrucomicrobiaceae bacterium SCGC AG-212-N21]
MFTESGAAHIPVLPPALPDALGRPLRDLRLSVTDRCNFRCTYCMPKELFGQDHPFLPKSDVLTFEEMTRLARLFVGLGVEKIRLTGGEPLLRRNLPDLIARLSRIEGLHDLTLTTNGSALVSHARPLRDAGLQRLTVSLDALDDATFRAMNDVDFPLERVLAGIDVALCAGFAPIKINMVVKRGVNDEQILPMVRRFKDPRFIVRFIEFMDVGSTNGWRMQDVMPASEIIARISREFPLQSIAPNYPGEVARRWRHADGAGEIGVIASVTQPFCQGCTRARISADGHLYTCLFASTGHDLRTLLRSGADDAALERVLSSIWSARSDRYSQLRTQATTAALPKVEMSHIGG